MTRSGFVIFTPQKTGSSAKTRWLTGRRLSVIGKAVTRINRRNHRGMSFLTCSRKGGIPLTDNETLMILGTLRAAYPMFYRKMSRNELDRIVALWASMFQDDSPETVTLAVKKLIATHSDFPPDIAAVRRAMVDVSAVAMPSAGEAWGEVSLAIRHYGHIREREALETMSAATRKAVKYIGWQAICLDENETATRAHFLKIYQSVADRETERRLIPAGVMTQINAAVLAGIDEKKISASEPEKICDNEPRMSEIDYCGAVQSIRDILVNAAGGKELEN